MHIEASANVGGLVLHFRTDMQTMECVRSMVDEGIRIVVIVDNSNDEGRSAGRMRPALERMSGIGLVFEIVSPGRNLGFARGVNAGLMRVVAYRPDAVLLINSDAKLESGSLANLLRALDRAPLAIPQVRGAAGGGGGQPLGVVSPRVGTAVGGRLIESLRTLSERVLPHATH
jgi:N-acetylglucosaminyl-diphospho-decaprenol L-rhamnosyltransferase